MLDNTQLAYLVALHQIPYLGNGSLHRAFAYFSSPQQIFEASQSELVRAQLFSPAIENLLSRRATLNPEQELEKIHRSQTQILYYHHPQYPPLLKHIHQPPFILYAKGSLDVLERPLLAVVGTRRISAYGRDATHHLVSKLAQAQINIVSGLAHGVDMLAHETSLCFSSTLAVVGSGIGWFCSQRSSPLINKILSRGLILSQFPFSTPANPSHFPMRNRIISGVSMATLVIEAGERSGALITANFALEQDRDVFAVPGNIFSHQSKGTNFLIQNGAKLIGCAEDIFSELPVYKKTDPLPPVLSSLEQSIYDLLVEKTSLPIDELAWHSQLSIPQISQLLTQLQLKSIITQLPNNHYALT